MGRATGWRTGRTGAGWWNRRGPGWSGGRNRRRLAAILAAVVLAVALPGPTGGAAAQDAGADAGAADDALRPRFQWSFEGKAHYRDSEEVALPVPFPFPPELLPPGGERGFAATVDPGEHLELSVLTLHLDAEWGPALAARVKLDFIDLHDRNPTSSDREFDVDEAWVRFGRETAPALLPESPGVYVKVGKMPKFERQDDRHLESYGLVSTAFNRFEDMGVEVGADLGRYLYLKATATQGNPVFLRDPNALAGDNGTPEAEEPFPEPDLGTGITIPYDAEVEDLDGDGEVELGGALGARWSDVSGLRGVDLMLFGYRRDLADSVPIRGSFYGGDLDLLLGPGNAFPFPVDGVEKEEVGANLWLYLGGFSLFAQAVDQDLAGLGRLGLEAEVAYRFDLPLVAGLAGQQLFPSIQPAVRWSRLDPDFDAPPVTPSPSFAWEWEKLDVGVRITLVRGMDLTAELARNEFVLGSGARRTQDEVLITLRWRS